MKYENLKRIFFLEKFIIVIAVYFFLFAGLHYLWLSTSGIEYIVNYLISVAIYLLIAQIVKAERNQKLNRLNISEILMLVGVVALIALEWFK